MMPFPRAVLPWTPWRTEVLVRSDNEPLSLSHCRGRGQFFLQARLHNIFCSVFLLLLGIGCTVLRKKSAAGLESARWSAVDQSRAP